MANKQNLALERLAASYQKRQQNDGRTSKATMEYINKTTDMLSAIRSAKVPTVDIYLENIHPRQVNEFTDVDITTLVESIKATTLIHPIAVENGTKFSIREIGRAHV